MTELIEQELLVPKEMAARILQRIEKLESESIVLGELLSGLQSEVAYLMRASTVTLHNRLTRLTRRVKELEQRKRRKS